MLMRTGKKVKTVLAFTYSAFSFFYSSFSL